MQRWLQRSVIWPRCSRTATRTPPTNSLNRCRTKEGKKERKKLPSTFPPGASQPLLLSALVGSVPLGSLAKAPAPPATHHVEGEGGKVWRLLHKADFYLVMKVRKGWSETCEPVYVSSEGFGPEEPDMEQSLKRNWSPIPSVVQSKAHKLTFTCIRSDKGSLLQLHSSAQPHSVCTEKKMTKKNRPCWLFIWSYCSTAPAAETRNE